MERRRWVTAPSSVRSLVDSGDFFREEVPGVAPEPEPLPRLALRGFFDLVRLLY